MPGLGDSRAAMGMGFLGIVQGMEERRKEALDMQHKKDLLKLEQDKIKIHERENELKALEMEQEFQKMTAAATAQVTNARNQFLQTHTPVDPIAYGEAFPYGPSLVPALPGVGLPEDTFYMPRSIAEQMTPKGKADVGEAEAKGAKSRFELNLLQKKALARDTRAEMINLYGGTDKMPPAAKARYIASALRSESSEGFKQELDALGLGSEKGTSANAKVVYTEFVAQALGKSTAETIQYLESTDREGFIAKLLPQVIKMDDKFLLGATEKEIREKSKSYADMLGDIYDRTKGYSPKDTSSRPSDVESHIERWKKGGGEVSNGLGRH